jgi:hypothetical protein
MRKFLLIKNFVVDLVFEKTPEGSTTSHDIEKGLILIGKS